MTQSTIITRRTALAGGLAGLAAPAFAGAPLLGPLRPVANRVKLGAFEVTTVFDGAVVFGCCKN